MDGPIGNRLSRLSSSKIGGSSSKPIILGEPSVKGEIADNFGFQEDPPISKLFEFEAQNLYIFM